MHPKFEELSLERREHYRQMWTSRKGEWVLVGEPGGRLSPIHVVPGRYARYSMRLIEDDELAQFVVEQMAKAGVQVFDSLADLDRGLDGST